MDKWDQRFMSMAQNEIASWSVDPKRKVGAVLVSPDHRQWSGGDNGPPRGVPWDAFVPNRKNEYVIHAEANAILNAVTDLRGWTLYVTKPPCLSCAALIIQKQIARVVMPTLRRDSSWWKNQLEAQRMFNLVGIEVTCYADN